MLFAEVVNESVAVTGSVVSPTLYVNSSVRTSRMCFTNRLMILLMAVPATLRTTILMRFVVRSQTNKTTAKFQRYLWGYLVCGLYYWTGLLDGHIFDFTHVVVD